MPLHRLGGRLPHPLLRAAVAAGLASAACATGEIPAGFPPDIRETADDSRGEGGDGAACDPALCLLNCVASGRSTGNCSGDTCICDEAADADTDADADGDADADADADGDADADADVPDVADDGEASDVPPDGGACTVADFPVQAQCRAGFKCTIGSISRATATPVCDIDGAAGHDAPCSDAAPPATTDTCRRFHYCLSDGVESSCRRFCANHSQCSAAHGTSRSGCVLTLAAGSGGSVAGVRFCTVGCDARSDTGCRASQTCRPAGDVSGAFTDCSRYGAGVQGAPCSLGGDAACARRHVCLNAGGGAKCYRFCHSHADCLAVGSTSACLYSVTDAAGVEYPEFDVCSEQCDPLADSVCSAGVTSCRIGSYRTALGDIRFASACTLVGAGGQGASCTGDADCRAGFTCITLDGVNRCLQYCRRPSGSPACPAPTRCNDATPLSPGSWPAAVGLCY
ncbi:MAG: hypothetical protein QME96_03755 [Myxococcota bacterium]|nr:hypothetical protein [Myxococcota bacterium]